MKVIKITKTNFELEDGRVFEHPMELDETPTLEEFQKMYDKWEKTLKPQKKKEDKCSKKN